MKETFEDYIKKLHRNQTSFEDITKNLYEITKMIQEALDLQAEYERKGVAEPYWEGLRTLDILGVLIENHRRFMAAMGAKLEAIQRQALEAAE